MQTNFLKIFLAAALTWAGTSRNLLAAEIISTNAPALRVGVCPNSPPMIFKEGKKIVGLEVDMAQALGQTLGRPVQFVSLPREDLMDALEGDKIDIIMSSMTITRSRQFRIAFSDPYLRVGQMILVRDSEKYAFVLGTDPIEKRRVGVKQGTTADFLVRQEFPRAKRKYFETGEAAAKALEKKQIDLFMSDSPMIWYLSSRYEAQGLAVSPRVFSDEFLGWGVRRTDTQLLDSVNGFLKASQASGELDRILHRWIPKFQPTQ
jgi:polar amino acid transport system substrate-binding protein